MLRAVEIVRHRLSLAVRVDDHFTGQPAVGQLDVALDTKELPVKTSDHRTRHPDGTYRFINLEDGPRQLTVSSPTTFTWTASTPVTIPRFDPLVDPPSAALLVVEVWPTANAPAPAGTLAVRGRVDAPAPAAPVAAGQQVELEAVSSFPARNRKTRIDAAREFLFLVLGPMALNAQHKVPIKVKVPGRSIASIEVREPGAITTSTSDVFTASPGREVRVVINLS